MAAVYQGTAAITGTPYLASTPTAYGGNKHPVNTSYTGFMEQRDTFPGHADPADRTVCG